MGGGLEPASPGSASITVLTEQYDRAVAYAVRMHAGQVRKGTSIPYVAHPLAVSALVLEAGGTQDEAIAGLLHDVAEDCGGEPRLVEIARAFGPQVERIVRACSDSITEDAQSKAPWRDRKERHLEHLRQADRSIALVTVADKLHNAGAILADVRRDGIDTLARFSAGPDDLCWYYTALAQVLATTTAPPSLVRQLVDTVDRLVSSIRNVSRPIEEGQR